MKKGNGKAARPRAQNRLSERASGNMNGSPQHDSLKLQVENFGPIVKANVGLRPLTVFVGPSNTGKSYLAVLIYALHRFFFWRIKSFHWSSRRDFPIFRNPAVKISQKTIDSLAKMARSFLDDQELLTKEHTALPPLVADAVCRELEVRGNDLLSREINRCFGINETSALIRKEHKRSAHIVLQHHASEPSGRFEHTLILTKGNAEFRMTRPREMPIRINAGIASEMTRQARSIIKEVERNRSEIRNFYAWDFLDSLISPVLPYVAGDMCRPAYYLPADRTGVMHAHSVVVSALIRNAPTVGLRPSIRTPMLSGVLADFLEQLIEIDRPRRSRRKRRPDLGEGIEEAILGGTVHVDRSDTINYPLFIYRPKGWKNDLPLMNASSMVSELAPVVLYLRHMVRRNDVLIIEEPESHLHPAMQVEFTRQIAALVNMGIRVIVTTHSVWLLEELANIVKRAEIPRADHEVSADAYNSTALSPDKVGAWLFKPTHRPKGSTVTAINLDDSGLYSSGFDEVASALHNDWAEISSRIGDGS